MVFFLFLKVASKDAPSSIWNMDEFACSKFGLETRKYCVLNFSCMDNISNVFTAPLLLRKNVASRVHNQSHYKTVNVN